MNMKIENKRGRVSQTSLFSLLLLTNLAIASSGWTAAPRFYEDRNAFLAALGSSQVLTQDFNVFAVGATMTGATLLSGVTVSSSFLNLTVWQDHALFGYDNSTRPLGNGCYEFNLTGYNAVAFEIMGWDPASAGPAKAIVHLGDGSTVQVERRQTGATESAPVFFGVIADQPVIRIEWHESPEVYGGGNEEVSLDNLLCAATPNLPSPTPLALAGTWEPDAYTDHGARLVIRQTGTGWFIHGYGFCSPDFCDWGEVVLQGVQPHNADAFDGWFAVWDFSFKNTYLWLRLDGQALVVESIDLFEEFDGRAPYSVLSRMHQVPSGPVSITPVRNPAAGSMTLKIPANTSLKLQRCADLKAANWANVPLPAGTTEYEALTTGQQGFFRLINQ